jgi:integrase
LPEHLRPKSLELSEGGHRRETPTEWRARLGPEGLAEAGNWRKAHSWTPHQLRHAAGTAIRKEYGIESARIILGHSTAFTTEVYAEADRLKAQEIVATIG